MKHVRALGRVARGLFTSAWQSVVIWVVVLTAIGAVIALVATQTATVNALRDRNFSLGHQIDQASTRYDRLFGEYSRLYAESENQGVDPSTTNPTDVPDKATNGTSGTVGATGATGQTGAQGPRGDIGVPGQTGPQGPAGAAGAKGDAGKDGAPGAAGVAGNDGTAGAQGVAGAQGPKGDSGPAGPAGAAGAAGANGAPGADGRSVSSVACIADGLATYVVFYDQNQTEIGRVQTMCTPPQ